MLSENTFAVHWETVAKKTYGAVLKSSNQQRHLEATSDIHGATCIFDMFMTALQGNIEAYKSKLFKY